MKALSELADKYEQCAKANEATAEMILAGLISFSLESQERQSARADWLITEAMALREKAAEIGRSKLRCGANYAIEAAVINQRSGEPCRR